MEPEPTKNIERGGFSMRRISSILKAPRKSTSFPYPEQQENVVECAKPGEKRRSKRVSFAATDGVLLFSKDVRNTSPARSPFQALPATTSGSTSNRGQVEVTDDCSQHIAGMESLLNAPLHDYQQRDKVKFVVGEDLGEKTIMFPTHDASMDMTQSHTINIGNDSDLPGDVSFQSADVFPSVRDNRAMFPVEPLFTDNTPASTARSQRNAPALMPSVDPDFENFLASLSKVPVPNVKAPVPRVTPPGGHFSEDRNRPFNQTQRVDPDKENQVPPSVFSVMRKSLNASRKSEEFPAALCPKETLTAALSDCTQDSKEEVDPFQWLFPSQEMYASSDRTAPQKTEAAKTSFLPTSGRRFTAGDAAMDVTESHTANIVSDFGLKPFQNLNVVPPREDKTVRFSVDDAGMDVTTSHTVNIATHMGAKSVDSLATCGERTVRFSADDAGMDVTSHTVNIATHMGPKLPRMDSLATCGERTVRFSVDDAGMDVTTSHTVNIATDFNLPSQQNLDVLPTCGERTVRFSADDAGMDVTKSHTVNIATDFKLPSQQNPNVAVFGERTVRFSVDDAGMDVTKSHTVSIATDFDLPSQHNLDVLPTCGERTVRFSADDAGMDVTKSHTVNIATDFNVQSHKKNLDVASTCGEKTVRFIAEDAGMDITRSQTVNIASHIEAALQNVDRLFAPGEKTVRFSADDAGMDVTKSHTVNIATDFKLPSQQNPNVAVFGERTVRFSVDDAGMDVTKSHTVNIASQLETEARPTCGEKTVRFTTDDAAMEETKSHTVNIAAHLKRQSQNFDPLRKSGEKTLRFSAEEAAMDVTRSHTVNISTGSQMRSHQSVDIVPAAGETTVRFTTNDEGMDVTRSHTGNISIYEPKLNEDFTPAFRRKTVDLSVNDETDLNQSSSGKISSSSSSDALIHRRVSPIQKILDSSCASGKESSGSHEDRSSSACVLDGHMSKAETFVEPLPQETTHEDQTQKPDVDKQTEASDVNETSVNKTTTDGLDEANMDLTEPQTGHILERMSTGEAPQCVSLTLKQESETSEEPGPSRPDDVAFTNLPESLEANKTTTGADFEPSSRTCPMPQTVRSSRSPVDKDAEMIHSRKSRRKSLADLQLKVRRLSHLIHAAPEPTTTESSTALSSEELDTEKNSGDKPKSPPSEPNHQMVHADNNTQDVSPAISEQFPVTVATPFNLKTKQLMSRISLGDIQPKLPQRSKPDDSKKANPPGDLTRTVDVSKHLSDFDDDVSDICDEELGSLEDMSETFDAGSLHRTPEKTRPPVAFELQGSPEDDDVFEEDFVQGQKRPSPEDDNRTESEKRMKTSSDSTEMEVPPTLVECDSNTAAVTSGSIESSGCSHTASIGYETTFESTFKQSLFESQLEDDASEIQMKLVDGTITVLDFFKLFNIDYVIHNPRQSVHPGGLSSDAEATPLDVLRNKHISLPKVMVYKRDVQALTEKVESLKVQIGDLDKPLKTFNRRLWEEMRHYSEKELKAFGAKLKERNNFFRKTGKAQSHERKGVLHQNLVQAHLEEQQKLKGSIEETDEMIRSLDDCILELHTEIAALDEKGSKNKPSLKSLQEELKKSSETLSENELQISELQLQSKRDTSKLKRLEAESRTLESHMDTLNTLSEWECRERRDDGAVYTFLHQTVTLQLTFEKSSGNDADSNAVQKITNIDFKFELDEEKSQCHARLVHTLVSQFVEGESAWLEKYPTSGDVPQLLLDVGLVVGRCRLLGDECRRLRLWGSLPLDILHLGCVDDRIRIVFSSLSRFTKFEVVFAVSLNNDFCALRVDSFTNMIGSTEIKQIEEIVASVSQAENVLTTTVRKLHDALLK